MSRRPESRVSQSLASLGLGLLLTLSYVPAGSASEGHESSSHESSRYESPPVLAASDVLPTEMLEGERHAVDPDVFTDGFLAYFTIHSDYGTFEAASVEEAAIRIREIHAIASLIEMDRKKVAGEAVIEGVKQPFLAAHSVVTRPGETASRVGESLGRWVERGKLSLHKTKRKAEQSIDEWQERQHARQEEDRQERAAEALAEQEVHARAIDEGRDPDQAVADYRRRRAEDESSTAAADRRARREEQLEAVQRQVERAAYRYIGYDKARRRLAQSLGVDPYSTNLLLQKHLDAVAWALWAGQFGSGSILPTSTFLDTVGAVDDLVWSLHPKDLEVRNRERLEDMGVDRDLIDQFLENRNYTRSDVTVMIANLAGLDGVENRDHLFRLAADATNRRAATFYRRSAAMLARSEAKLDRIVRQSENFVAALTSDHDVMLLLPVDHLAWTESLDLVAGSVERHRRAVDFEGSVLLLLAGDATVRARKQLESLGWQVRSQGLQEIAGDDSLEITSNREGTSGGSS